MNTPTQSKAIVASRFGYPFKDKQDREITDPQALHEGLAFVQGGHYLLGAHGFFHGGIHFDRSCSNAFSLDQGIRCLADGEVVAYRVNREYLDATRGTPGDGPNLRPYSTGFVLVRHRLQAPTPPQPDKPAPMAHPMADTRNLGTYLYADPEGRQRARWLRHGTPLTVEIGKYTPGRQYVRVLGVSGSSDTGWISPVWLALDRAAGTSLYNVLGFKDQVVTFIHGGDHPDPDRVAAYKQNTAERARAAPAPAPTLTLYSLYMHLADFADYRAQSKWQRPGWWSAPQYRVGEKAKDRQAAAPAHAEVPRSIGLNVREEPSGKSAILGLLPRGACNETGERSPNGKWARIFKMLAGEIDSPVAGGHVPVGALNGWVYLGELMADTRPEAFDRVVTLDKPCPIRFGDVVGYLGEDVPSRANPIANQPVSRRLLHLEVFSADDVPAYLAASRQWAAATLTDKERTLLLLRPGDTLHAEPNGAVACTLNWTQILPLSALESKDVDGQRWRKVKGLMLDNGRMSEGWAKEAGHLASPWEWPGFDVVDEYASSSGGIFEDAAAWAGFIKREGPRPEETPFYKQLRRMLDTNHDGQVSEQELDAALRDRSKAAHMARIIVRHDSAWAKEPAARQRSVMTRIAELVSAGAVEQVEAEAPRAGKLPWWDEVAAGVDGFPKAPRVYHFHPGGLAGNLVQHNASGCCDLDVAAFRVIFGERKIFNHRDMPRGGDSYEARVESFIELLNEGFSRYGFDKCIYKHHFMAQCFHESDHFNTTVEYASGWDYDISRYPEVVCSTSSPEYSVRKCRRRHQILSEGNLDVGDGPKYKGKGIIQLTWKGTYKAYGSYSGKNVVDHPMLLAEDLATAVDSAFWFWAHFKGEHINRKIDRFYVVAEKAGLDNEALDDEVVRLVTRVVNGGDRGLTERQQLFRKIKKAMK